MKRAVTELGSRALDGRSVVARELARWQEGLILDLGGDEAISTQKRALIEIAMREKLLLDSIDAWLLSLGAGVFDKKKRAIRPVVRERTALADALQRRLTALGLERRPREVRDLDAILAERATRKGSAAESVDAEEVDPS